MSSVADGYVIAREQVDTKELEENVQGIEIKIIRIIRMLSSQN